MEFHHVSVLQAEIVHAVAGDPTGIYVDCTLGGGGHSRALAELLAPTGTIIGLDRDKNAVAAASERMMPPAGLFRYNVISKIWVPCWTNWILNA